MEDLSSKVCTVIDNGLFVDIALRIAPAFKKVYYFSPWQSPFPSSSKMLPGDGFDEIERVRWRFDAIEKSDLVVYPDVYFCDEQEFLAKRGMPVWGGRKGELLELNRWKQKQLFRDAGLPVGHAELIHGIDDLKKYLKEHPNVWVKLSCNRGDAETFHSPNYELIEPRVNEMAHVLGAKQSIVEFIVEDSIDDAVEFGYDGFNIDGEWPVRSFFGLERKDEAFIGKVIEYTDFPEVLKKPNDVMSPYFKQHNYRGFYSSELRVTNSVTAYPIDPCTRAPSPPHEIYMEIFDNWPDIIWNGARGRMTDPNPVKKYGVCAMMHSAWASKNWLPIRFPESIRQWVKLRNHCRIDDVDYFVPQPDSNLPEIGALVGLGDSLQEAEDHLKENAKQIEAYDVEIKVDCLDAAQDEINEAKKFGIEI